MNVSLFFLYLTYLSLSLACPYAPLPVNLSINVSFQRSESGTYYGGPEPRPSQDVRQEVQEDGQESGSGVPQTSSTRPQRRYSTSARRTAVDPPHRTLRSQAVR